MSVVSLHKKRPAAHGCWPRNLYIFSLSSWRVAVHGVPHFFCCSEGALSVLLDKAPVMMRTVTKERKNRICWWNQALRRLPKPREGDSHTPTYSERSLDYFYQVALPLHAAILKSNQIHHLFLRRGFMLPPFYAGIKIGNIEVIIMTVFSRKIMRQYTFYIVLNFKTL